MGYPDTGDVKQVLHRHGRWPSIWLATFSVDDRVRLVIVQRWVLATGMRLMWQSSDEGVDEAWKDTEAL